MGAARRRLAAAALPAAVLAALARPCAGRMQVVLDTDVGLDMDDSWALAYILSSPHLFDLRLVVTASGDTAKRAQAVAKYLTLAGRTDVPIGVGPATRIEFMQDYLGEWAADVPLENYSGRVGRDGVGLMADVLSRSTEPSIIAIGPFTNLEALGRRFPEAARRARVYAMGGSIYRGYGNASGPAAEYNVATDVPAARFALRDGTFRSWFLAPLDTTGLLQLSGDRYGRLLEAERGASPPALLRALLGSYRAWFSQCSRVRIPPCMSALLPYTPENASTGLWDVLPPIAAVWKASQRRPLGEAMRVAEMRLCVTEGGLTVRRPDAAGCARASVALSWQPGGTDAVEEDLVAQLLGRSAGGAPRLAGVVV